ncbi:lamin tail domain-containing protein, partial [bacterium]|nr:lamin tail domain-containing protein [bacterium]
MRGKVHRTRAGYWKGEITHDYKWIGKPEITIEFPEKMPDIKITKKSFFDRLKDKIFSPFQKTQIAKERAEEKTDTFFSRIGTNIKEFFDKIKKKITNPFGASIGSRIDNSQFFKEKSSTEESPQFTPQPETEKEARLLNLPDTQATNNKTDKELDQKFPNQSEEPEYHDDNALKKQEDNQKETQTSQEKEEKEEKEENKKESETDKEIEDSQKDLSQEEGDTLNKETPPEKDKSLPPLLIAEVCAGIDSSKNELIKIYNPNNEPVEINSDNFVLQIVNSKNKATQKRIEWTRNTIPAKGFFLFASNIPSINGKIIEPDAKISTSLTSVSGVIISDKKGRILDKVAWGKPGQPAPYLATEGKPQIKIGGLKTGESLRRKKSGAKYIDTNNNDNDFEFSDFVLIENSLGERTSFIKGFSAGLPAAISGSAGNNSQSIQQGQNTNQEKQIEPFFKILITEVQISGENASEDFVELYNPNDVLVDLSSWQIKKRTSSGKESSLIKMPDGTVIPSYGYILWANSKDDYAQEINADVSTKNCLSQNNSIALFDREKRVIDALSWGEGENQFLEGEGFPENPEAGQTISRKFSEDDNKYIDTDNNASDFVIGNPTPRAKTEIFSKENLENRETAENPEGNSNNNGENKETEKPNSEPQHLIISEVSTKDPEFIEIFNPTDSEISLSDKYLAYFSSQAEINNPYRTWQFDENLKVLPHSHFVILIYQKKGKIDFDWQVLTSSKRPYSREQISDDGAVGIFNCDPRNDKKTVAEQCAIDLLGWNNALVKEKETGDLTDETKGLSRKTTVSEEGILTYQDTDNNSQDFELTEKNPKKFSNQYLDLDNDGIVNDYDSETIITQTIELPPDEYHFQNIIIKEGGKIIFLSDKEKEFPSSKIFAQNVFVEKGGEISATEQGLEEPGDTDLNFSEINGLGFGSCSENKVQCRRGGGIVYVEAINKIVIDGLVSSDGESEQWGNFDGANGGGIFLKSSVIEGKGIIRANGGDTEKSQYGGDGGKIILETENNNFEGDIQAFGGHNQEHLYFKGRAGTIFINSPEKQTLIIRNDLVSDSFFKRHKEKILPNLEVDELILENIVADFEENAEFQVSNIEIKNSQINLLPEKILKVSGDKLSLQASVILANIEINTPEVFINEDSIISAQGKGFSSSFAEEINKDLFEPDFLAKGGKQASEKAFENRGGGKIIIQSQEIKIDGILEVNGEKGKSVGFAAENNINGADAGAVFIRTQKLSGKGVIKANGGDDGSKAGNGGRIAIYFQENNFEGDIQAFGGKGCLDRENENGGPGTIFLSNQKEGINQLIINNGGHQGVLDLSQDKLEMEDTQLYIKEGSIVVFPALVKSTALILEEGGLRLFGNSEIYVSEIFKLVKSFIESPQKKFLNINAQEINIEESEIVGNLKVKAENFEIDKNSSIIADALGYDADEGPGKGNGGSGAGYGGKGGNYRAFEGGDIYGDPKNISDFGSGGGTSTHPNTGQRETGGKGGGLIILEIEKE